MELVVRSIAARADWIAPKSCWLKLIVVVLIDPPEVREIPVTTVTADVPFTKSVPLKVDWLIVVSIRAASSSSSFCTDARTLRPPVASYSGTPLPGKEHGTGSD